jgi:hypothetical protein
VADIRNRFRAQSSQDTPTNGSTPDPSPLRTTAASPRARTESAMLQQPKRMAPKTISKQQTKVSRAKRQKRKSMKRSILVAVVVILLFGAGFFAYTTYSNHANSKEDTTPAPSAGVRPRTNPQPEVGNVRIVATGDMIAHSTVLDNARRENNTFDFFEPMKNMQPLFEKADVRFCNQSTLAGGPDFEYTGYPSFNAPFEWTLDMIKVGCNVVNLGTNHTNDKGQRMINAAVSAWDNQPDVLAIAGANRSIEEQARIRYFSAKGLKFAFLSYTTYSNNTDLTSYGVNMYSDDTARQQIKEARSNAQFVMVSMRWGTEYSPDIDATQKQIAQFLAEQGADIVLGHGPHVLGPVERLPSIDNKETIVWYSLGNFLNTQIPIETLVGGFAVIDIDGPNRSIKNIAFLPIYMHYDWSAQDRANNNLGARRNLQMLPLDAADELLAGSTHNTTTAEQQQRVTTLLNQFTEVEMLTSDTY